MFKWFKNLFKKKSFEMYQCLMLREGVITIALKSMRTESIEKYNVDPFEKSVLICEMKFNKLPIHKIEKKVLLIGRVIHFYNEQFTTLTKYTDLYEKILDIKKQKGN
jgi:hypothetical protein